MAQPHGRGHASYTYNITAVTDVDYDELCVTVTAEHSVAPITHHLGTAHRETPRGARPPIVEQIFSACVDSIEVRGVGGRWSSERSLEAALWFSGDLVNEFVRAGYPTLEDGRLDLLRIRAVLSLMSSNAQKRTLTWVVARAIESTGRADAKTLSIQLRNTSFPADQRGERTPYTDAEADVLRIAARTALDAIYETHRAAFANLGFDTSDRAWWNISADEALAAAEARDTLRDEPVKGRPLPPRAVGWGADQIIDWLLLNPGRVPDTPADVRAQGPRVARWQHGLYFPDHGIVAATILHCLLENRGYNFSTLINTGADDLIETGGGTGILRTAKARNHVQTRDGVYFGGKYSTTGGLLMMVKALTRFSRHRRHTLLEKLAESDHTVTTALADKFYVPFRSATTTLKIFEANTQHRSFRSGPLARAVKDAAADAGITVPTLRYQALRHYALYEGLKFDPDHDVAGHTPRTRVDYLAQCLPEATLHELGAGTQAEMHDQALRAFLGTEDGQRLSRAIEADMAADMVTNVCTSNLMDPDDADRPCSLGLAACFTCPNGYRTKDHVPGLLALQEFTARIGTTNPDEWANGEAGLLHAYATKSLTKFPSALVEAMRGHDEHENLVAIIAHLYTEFRRA